MPDAVFERIAESAFRLKREGRVEIRSGLAGDELAVLVLMGTFVPFVYDKGSERFTACLLPFFPYHILGAAIGSSLDPWAPLTGGMSGLCSQLAKCRRPGLSYSISRSLYQGWMSMQLLTDLCRLVMPKVTS